MKLIEAQESAGIDRSLLRAPRQAWQRAAVQHTVIEGPAKLEAIPISPSNDSYLAPGAAKRLFSSHGDDGGQVGFSLEGSPRGWLRFTNLGGPACLHFAIRMGAWSPWSHLKGIFMNVGDLVVHETHGNGIVRSMSATGVVVAQFAHGFERIPITLLRLRRPPLTQKKKIDADKQEIESWNKRIPTGGVCWHTSTMAIFPPLMICTKASVENGGCKKSTAESELR